GIGPRRRDKRNAGPRDGIHERQDAGTAALTGGAIVAPQKRYERYTGGRAMQTETQQQLRDRVAGAIDEHGPGIISAADQIHKKPEIGYQEFFASQLLADELKRPG